MRNLVELRVGNCPNISEHDLVELLPEFGQLEKLDLAGSPIRTETIRALATLTNLVDLNLSGTKVGDDGLAMLANLKGLRKIHLFNTHVTDDGIAEFARSHPHCKLER